MFTLIVHMTDKNMADNGGEEEKIEQTFGYG